MSIPILVRRRLDIETAPRIFCREQTNYLFIRIFITAKRDDCSASQHVWMCFISIVLISESIRLREGDG